MEEKSRDPRRSESRGRNSRRAEAAFRSLPPGLAGDADASVDGCYSGSPGFSFSSHKKRSLVVDFSVMLSSRFHEARSTGVTVSLVCRWVADVRLWFFFSVVAATELPTAPSNAW